jgi:hypothetical protein
MRNKRASGIALYARLSVSTQVLLPVHGSIICFFAIVATASMDTGSMLIKATRKNPACILSTANLSVNCLTTSTE